MSLSRCGSSVHGLFADSFVRCDVINNVSVDGQIAYENLNFDFPAFSGNGVRGDGLIVAGQQQYFALANLMLALKESYETLSTSGLGIDLRHIGWLIDAKTEDRLTTQSVL